MGMAAVFDFFDGMSARLLNGYSDLGKELDSLSDLVSESSSFIFRSEQKL